MITESLKTAGVDHIQHKHFFLLVDPLFEQITYNTRTQKHSLSSISCYFYLGLSQLP